MLNNKQQEAVYTTEGNLRIIAGAGSGKTRTLTERYMHLLNLGAKPYNILCVTFTNKAADEMKERISKKVNEKDLKLISTFHSFCLKLLRKGIHKLGFKNNFSVLDTTDQKQILRNIYKDCKIDFKNYSYATAISVISEFKYEREELILKMVEKNDSIKSIYEELKKDLLNGTTNNYEDTLANCVFYGYLWHQQKAMSLDYDDLLILAVKLLETDKKTLEKWQTQLQYIMVDEFQDASEIQFKLVSLLSKKHGNLFVVGDPDQTIYSWRGAEPKILVNFDKTMNAETVILNQNYRSTPHILKVANDLIANNKLRVPKDLYTERTEGKKPVYNRLLNPQLEGEWIAHMIEVIKQKGFNFKDVAILYRAHYISRAVEEALINKRIPYVIHSGVNFYERKEIKDILSYLRIIVNPSDDVALERIINVPTRGVGPKKLDAIKSISDAAGISLWDGVKNYLQSKPDFKLEDFIIRIAKLRQEVKKMKLSEFVFKVYSDMGYENVIALDEDEQERRSNIQELIHSIEDIEETRNISIDEYLQEIALLTNSDRKDKGDCVTLMTIHSSKGLEFPYVFVCGMSEGLFPSQKATTEEEMEEERRLAYVAYTRAEKGLILTESDGTLYTGERKITSRFLTELNEDDLTMLKPFAEEDEFVFY